MFAGGVAPADRLGLVVGVAPADRLYRFGLAGGVAPADRFIWLYWFMLAGGVAPADLLYLYGLAGGVAPADRTGLLGIVVYESLLESTSRNTERCQTKNKSIIIRSYSITNLICSEK